MNRALSHLIRPRLFCALAVLAIAASAVAEPVWYDSGWHWRQQVTVAPLGNATTLANYPALVQITNPANPLFANAQANGQDIFFTDANGIKLDHETESYSPAGELDAWVRIPQMPATGTTLYMYYKNASAPDQQNAAAVWDSDFKMVQHLQEDPTGTLYDSTSNDNDGTSAGAMTSGDQVPGQINGSLDLDGSNDAILCGTDPSLNISDVVTVEAWVNPTVTGQHGIISSSDSYGRGYHLYLRNTANGMVGFWFNDGSATNATKVYITGNVAAGQWNYLAGVYDGTAMHIYANGAHYSSSSVTTYSYPIDYTGMKLGHIPWVGTPRYLNGMLDEVRISNTARSTDWITASYNNTGEPGAYLSFDEPVPFPEPATMALFGAGAALAALRRRRQRR